MKHLSVDVYTYNQIKNKDCVINDVILKHLSVDVYTYNQIKNKDCVLNDATFETVISWCIHIHSN